MQSKRKSGKSFKIPFIFAFAAFVALAYAVVNLITMQVEIAQKTAEYEALSDKLYELRTENEMLERYTSDEYKMGYVEEIAREELDYSYSDEKIYYFMPTN
ncbi:MAG: septum formation initiator family protein [Ruminiclostridium sp.]|nr:septum formation initiator family protein [Ruminiclostridium sp.]HBI51759.1 septum formation initiator [Oscillospiraceae bacterium]